MWYGIFPSAAVILVAMSIPHMATYYHNKFFLGNPYRRYMSNMYEFHTYLRDKRLGDGDPYKQLGLDCLSESPEVEVKESCKCP